MDRNEPVTLRDRIIQHVQWHRGYIGICGVMRLDRLYEELSEFSHADVEEAFKKLVEEGELETHVVISRYAPGGVLYTQPHRNVSGM